LADKVRAADIDIYTTGYVRKANEARMENFQNLRNANGVPNFEKQQRIRFERVVSDSEVDQANDEKKILLFLPGLDGQGDYSANVFINQLLF
jgi:hypothetical protein